MLELVDKAIELDINIKKMQEELDEIKATIQSYGLSEIENRNLKYLQLFGEKGSCDLTYKQKLEVENINLLREVFGEIIDSKVSKKEEIKYKVENKFKSALIALYLNDYKEHDVQMILAEIGLDDKAGKLAIKKLKGEYIADKKLLESLGAVDEDGLEEELDAIRESKNFENLSRYVDLKSVNDEMREKLKRAVYVEDTLSLGLSYEK